MKEALVYLLAITIAEVITVTNEPVWGLVCQILELLDNYHDQNQPVSYDCHPIR